MLLAASACRGEIESPPPATLSSWITCANQGEFCAFTATRRVRYSVDTRHALRTYSDGVRCDAAQFGMKSSKGGRCQFDSSLSSGTAKPATPAPSAAGSAAPQPLETSTLVISSALLPDKTTVRAGETLRAAVTYTNPSLRPIEIWTITIAGRREGARHVEGPYDDLTPSQSPTTLGPGASVTLTASRTFSAVDPVGRWELYATYQDDRGAWHDGPSVFFSVAAPSEQAAPATPVLASTPAPAAAPSASGTMKIGTNFWYHTRNENNWSGETSMKTGIDWATAYGAGTNGLASIDVWNEAWLSELAPYSTLRFMDWGNTNFSKIVSWSQRMLPNDPGNYEVYIDATSPADNPGMAYEWMIDLGNRTKKDIWICIPAQTDANYWTQLATLLKNKLHTDRKVYIEYSNETWNGSFGQFQYTIDQGVAQALPGGNQWYKGQAYAMWQSVKIFQAFENVFGSAAMGTRVVRVFAYGGNMDTGRQALANVYESSVWNPSQQKIDMLALAPYIGSSLDGASPNIQSEFHHAIAEHEFQHDDGELGSIAFAVQDLKRFGIAALGTYEGGQHLLKNSQAWSENPKIYDEYIYMLDRWSQYFSLFVHYSHTGKWTNAQYQSSWGAKDHTGQPLSEAHKYRAIVDWVNTHAR